MKVTMHNKDDIARQIAASAWKQPDDAISNNMLRVSDALTAVGTTCSPFRTLASFRTEFIPSGEETTTRVTYTQALIEAMMIADSDMIIPID